MKLSDYTPEVVKVPLGKQGHFEVRGLSFIDITAMLRSHQADMELIFQMYEDATDDAAANKENLGDALILKLLTEAPLLAGEIIRIAAGDLEATSEQVRLLPFPTQAVALMSILRLTFEEVGGVKNFLGTLLPMLSQIGVKVPTELTDALMKRAAQLSTAS